VEKEVSSRRRPAEGGVGVSSRGELNTRGRDFKRVEADALFLCVTVEGGGLEPEKVGRCNEDFRCGPRTR